jgi:hypothetical protein
MASYWDNEAHVEELKRRWLAGETSNQIAHAMQIGRGAVVSKINRIPDLPPRASRPRAHKPRPPRHNQHNPAAIARSQAQFKSAMARAEADKVAPPIGRQSLLVLDKNGNLAANDQFGDRHCHWPLDTKSEQGLTEYCGNGALRGSSYCAHHIRRVFQPVALRPRLEDFAQVGDNVPESRVSQEPATELATA